MPRVPPGPGWAVTARALSPRVRVGHQRPPGQRLPRARLPRRSPRRSSPMPRPAPLPRAHPAQPPSEYQFPYGPHYPDPARPLQPVTWLFGAGGNGRTLRYREGPGGAGGKPSLERGSVGLPSPGAGTVAINWTGPRLAAMERAALQRGLNIGDALQLSDLWLDVPPPSSIITSPPYLDMHDYGNMSQIGVRGQRLDDYLQQMVGVFRDCHEIAAADATFWLVAGSVRRSGRLIPLPDRLATCAEEAGWTLRESITWDKQKALPWTHHGELRDITEQVLLFRRRLGSSSTHRTSARLFQTRTGGDDTQSAIRQTVPCRPICGAFQSLHRIMDWCPDTLLPPSPRNSRIECCR